MSNSVALDRLDKVGVLRGAPTSAGGDDEYQETKESGGPQPARDSAWRRGMQAIVGKVNLDLSGRVISSTN